MIKIEQKIVGYSVVDSTQTPTVKTAESKMKLERPDVLSGTTYKIKTPLSEHALYVTINDCDGRPFELFVNSKAMEHFQWIVAFTRLISAVFRNGGNCAFLIDELRSVFDPKGGYFKKGGQYMPSLVAEIGQVIEDHLKKIGVIESETLDEHQKKLIAEKRAELEKKAELESVAFPKEATLCGKCQTKAVVLMDGCATCLNCSESKCG